MVERICPQCHYGNPLEHRFCGRCGASLERSQLPAPQDADLPLANRPLPETLKQVGQAVAVSLVALAADAGMAWLRRRVAQINAPQQPATMPPTPAAHLQPVQPVQHHVAAPSSSAALPTVVVAPLHDVTIHKQRVVQVWEHGTLKHQVVERTSWQRRG